MGELVQGWTSGLQKMTHQGVVELVTKIFGPVGVGVAFILSDSLQIVSPAGVVEEDVHLIWIFQGSLDVVDVRA